MSSQAGPKACSSSADGRCDVALHASFPFIRWTSGEDPDPNRLYYGKAFIYPLAAAPFVALFGTNGFMVLHALLMTLVFACAYAFLVVRSSPLASALFALAFVFVSVAPIYIVWMMPEIFNLSLIMFGYFVWAYKEQRQGDTGRRSRVAQGPALGPAGGRAVWHRHVLEADPRPARPAHAWRDGVAAAMGACPRHRFGVLHRRPRAVRDEHRRDGRVELPGRRSADVLLDGERGFPFQNEGATFDRTGMDRTTNRVPVEVLSSRDAVVNVFRHNLGYFLFGRHTGFAVYFFPGVVALGLFFWRWRDRPAWQWATLAAAVGSAVGLLLYMPFTYSGGGGPVGNRYYLGVYPLFLFLVPALAGVGPAILAMGVSAIFTAQLLFNPFHVSRQPGRAPEARTIPHAAGRAVAGERPADQHPRKPRASAAGGHAAHLRRTSSTTTPTTWKATGSGCAAARGRT